MPLASVDEWRARIGSSWCALGRPVKSRRPRYREYRYGSPPPGGGKRVKLQDGSVSTILMFILMVVAMLTLWSLILNGYSPICTSIMLCTSLDVVLMQCALCMSILSSSVSQPVSNIVLSVHRELKLGSGTKLEDFPYCTKFPIRSDLDLLTPGYSSYLSEQVETKVPVASTIKRNLFRSMSNFWHKLVEKVRSIKKCLSSAMVKFSLLLRCGDVEENPGPYDHEKDGGGTLLTERHFPDLFHQLKIHAAKWREIGFCLGFFSGELDRIQASPTLLMDAPFSYLRSVLSQWMQWIPGDDRGSANFATLEDLQRALSDAGLVVAAYDLHISDLDDTSSLADADKFSDVDSTTILGERDLKHVLYEVSPLKPRYFQLGRELGIPVHELETLHNQYGVVNIDQALNDMILLWLRGRTSRTWQALVRAVDSETGGNNHPLALEIASRHKADACFEINAEEEKHIAAVQKAMEERGMLDHTIVHGVFVGPARSGKNSIMERLLGQIPSTVSPSTGVAESVVHVKVMQKSTTNVESSIWSKMGYDDEAIKLISNVSASQVDSLITNIFQDSVISTVGAPEQISVATESEVTDTISDTKDSRIDQPIAAVDTTTQFQSLKAKRSSSSLVHKRPELPDSFLPPAKIVKSVLRRKGREGLVALQHHFKKRWSLYLTNTGGQMEFQEVLPLLVSGPSIFFYVFRLDRDINKRYMIEYDCEDGTKAEPYKSSLTTVEGLLQTLATIAAMGTFVYKGLQKCKLALRPKVFIVGTHKDQLDTETADSLISSVDNQLQEAIKSTAHYKDVVEFASPSQLIFAVNNFSEKESDFQDMRTAVERVVERDAFKMTSPAHWLIFSLVLRQIKSDVITYDQCREIARHCGLADEELDEALHFIHSKMGLIRYFPYDDIKHLVVLRPQFLFDTVTTFIVDTFTFTTTSKQVMDEFKKKGIFSLRQFEAISASNNSSLKPFLFAKLLECLRIAAPFHMDGQLKYFFPSVLAHTAQEPPLHQLAIASTPVPNVMVTFKCGYCPKGLACALVKYLMANEMKSSLKWKLDQDTIFRNQVSFKVGPFDTVVLKISSSHLELICIANTRFENRVDLCPFNDVCAEIFKAVDSGIRQVTSDINYVSAEHSFTFSCECKDSDSGAHPGVVEYNARNVPVCLTCSKTGEPYPLLSNHKYWKDVLYKVITITSQPRDVYLDVNDKEKAVFNITAEGSEPLRFQWMKDDEPVEDKDNVEGTNGPKLTISRPKMVDEGQYHCIVSDDFGVKESQKVNLVLEAEMSSTLSSVDLSKLELALTEFLEKMKPEMDIKTAESGLVTKREVVECLQRIGAHHYSHLLRKRNGVDVLLTEVVKDILDEKIKKCGKGILPVLKIILCGVPRSGKTTFWQNLVGITQTHNQPSHSTGLAEGHAIDVNFKVDSATLLDWKLCDDSDSNEAIFEIYKKILYETQSSEKPHRDSEEHVPQSSENSHEDSERHEPQSSENSHEDSERHEPQSSEDSHEDSAKYASETHHQISENQASPSFPTPTSSEPPQTDSDELEETPKEPADTRISRPPPTTTSADDGQNVTSDSAESVLQREIDYIFNELKEKPGVDHEISRVKLMVNLIDTGGQSAFLHLLPLLTTGNALYLIFFSYEHPLEDELTDEFEGKRGTIKLPDKYTQIDVILQALRCVFTNITQDNESHVKVLIVGTHENSCSCGDQAEIDKSIKEKVQPFFKNDSIEKQDVLQYADMYNDERLILKVNNVREGNTVTEGTSIEEEFQKHRETLDMLFDDKTFPKKVLPGSWLLFSIVLRRLKKDVLLYEDCEYIGTKKLGMLKSEVKLALRHMHKNIGVVMHFGEVLCLRNIVICNPALIFRSVSSMIIQTYYDPFANRDDHLRFKKHAIFTYNSFVAKKDHPELLPHDKLIVLLQHIGAIAPIKTNLTFKCTLCQNNHAHEKPTQCIREEYILPCVLPDAMPGELRCVEERCRKTSAPLVITFEGEYTPVGGFCYLFAKLTAEQEGWELCTPKLHLPLAEDKDTYHDCSIYRNKVTFHVDENYHVTLISTPYCYKVFVDSSECIQYFNVWKAIHTLLDKCPNQAIQKKFKLAFDCTCSRTDEEHLMFLEPSPVSENYSPHHLTAICEKKNSVPTFKHVAKYMAWFKELKLVREPFQIVQIKKPGDKVTLGVKCAQNKNCSYTWKKDGVDVTPQNTTCNILVSNMFCKSDNGTYTCIVKESDCSEVVSTKLISDPIIKQPAHKQIKYCTSDATLSVSVDPKLTDPDTTSYQWIRYKQARSIDPVKDDDHFNGADSEELTVRNLTKEHAGVYCCVVTVSGVPIHSRKATLKVKDLFVKQPSFGEEVKYCNTTAKLNLQVLHEVKSGVSYQWCRMTGDDEVIIKNDDHFCEANSHQLEFSNLKKEHAGEYYCVVTIVKDGVRVYSRKTELKVEDLFVKQPSFGEETKYCTTTAKLSIQVDPKVQDKALYQWYGGRSKKSVKDDEHFSGANTCQLTVRNLKREHAGEYYCVVSVDRFSVHSRKAELQVQDLIREQPHFRGVEYCTSTIQLNIKVDPKVNVSYQWYRFIDNNEHQISNNDHFSGVNGCQLEIKDLKKEHAGEYYCVISIGNVHICSRKARLQVKDLFVRQPVSLDKPCCATAHFEVEVDAEEQNCKYYWHKDDNGCKSKDYIGADTPRLTIKRIRKQHEGEYRCVVTVGNSHDRVRSRKAKLTVKGNCSSALNSRYVVAVLLFIALVIVIILFAVSNHNGSTSSGLIMSCSASHHEIELGNSLHLWCNASGAQTKSIHWQWFHNGTQLANGDGGVKISEDSTRQTEIQMTNTTHDSGGIYTCNVTSEESSNDTSFTVQIIVPPDPVTNSNPVNVNESPAWEGGFSDDNFILPDKIIVSSEEAYFPHMNEAPDMLQLDYLENKETGKPVKIIERIGSDYSSVGINLLNDVQGTIINTIKSSERYIAEDVVREIFRRWIKGEGAPVSWKTLINTLKKAKFVALANEIVDALHTLT